MSYNLSAETRPGLRIMLRVVAVLSRSTTPAGRLVGVRFPSGGETGNRTMERPCRRTGLSAWFNAENFSSHHFQVTLIGGCRHWIYFSMISRHTRTGPSTGYTGFVTLLHKSLQVKLTGGLGLLSMRIYKN